MEEIKKVIWNKTYGDKIKFLETAEDSNGELLRFELSCEAGGEGPPLHYHPVQSESFEVLKGELSIICDGTKTVLGPGDTFTVEANSPHKWQNEGDEDLLCIIKLKPALKTEYFLESVYSLDVQGKTNRETGLPSTLQFAAILNECYGELLLVGPPIPAQKFMAKVIGGFPKIIGYKGFIPFPQK